MYGYKRIKAYNKDEHRIVAGAVDLGFQTIVHHKDGNKKNNNPENLEIMSRSDHAKLHGFGISIRSKHLIEIIDDKITCRKCFQKKDLCEMSKDKSSKCGYKALCKLCANINLQKYRHNKKLLLLQRELC